LQIAAGGGIVMNAIAIVAMTTRFRLRARHA
jgi:hypothetical protein